MNKTLFLSAGDVSGDEHCSLLIRELKRRHPDWNIVALAGPRSQEAGAQILASTQGMGVMGFLSAMAIVPRSLKLKKQAIEWAKENNPDIAIACDWGGFNTRVLPDLKQMGISTLYYFPPRSWQKGGEAGTQIISYCDGVATPFEWSADKLQKVGGNARWVGHPILEKIALLPPREQIRERLGFNDEHINVVLLPGSRRMEWKFIGPHLLSTVKWLREREPTRNWRFWVAAPVGAAEQLRSYFPSGVEIVGGQTLELLRAADFGLIKSGTSTLEAAALDLPQIVVYEVPRIAYLQVMLTGMRRKIRFAAMPNIMLGRESVPELLGSKCRASFIAPLLLNLMDSPERVAAMRDDYVLVRKALGSELPQSATIATADLLESILEKRS